MLEAVFLGFLCRLIGSECRRKKRAPLGFQIMLVLFWFGGEVLGFILGASASPGQRGIAYVYALMGAGAAATTVFIIVGCLPAKRRGVATAPAGSPPGVGGRSDFEAQISMKLAQDCEARHDWVEAISNWRQVMTRASDPQLIEFARQRGFQIQQWLSQHLGQGR